MRKGQKMSEESRQKLSLTVKEWWQKRELTDEDREKMGNGGRGKKQSAETVAKRNQANTGKKRSEESRKRISEAAKARGSNWPSQKGKKRSGETRRKISDANKARGAKPPSRLGVPNSEEQKAKIRSTHKERGIKPVPLFGDENPSKRPEVKAKISAARTGKPLSDEHKQSLSRNHRKSNPPETKAKMRKTHKARVAAGLWPWQGGKTSEAMLIRGSSEYREWRTAVFVRDEYTCQKCDQRGGKLQAHHIKSFADHSELRFDVSNGVTLCKPCHIALHREVTHG